MADDLPHEVKLLLRDFVTSFEDLELVLFLHRERARAWETEELSRLTRVDADQIAKTTASLGARGAIKIDQSANHPTYQYEPTTPELGHAIDMLAKAFELNPVIVLRELNERAIERMRSSAIRTFAHAFVIRKKEGDE